MLYLILLRGMIEDVGRYLIVLSQPFESICIKGYDKSCLHSCCSVYSASASLALFFIAQSFTNKLCCCVIVELLQPD